MNDFARDDEPKSGGNRVGRWCRVKMSALGQTQTIAAQRHVRFTPESGHVRCTTSCLPWAKSGHGTTVNRKTASVAVLAKSDQVYRLVTAVAFFHCKANRAAHAILKNLGGDFVAWLSSSSE